MADNLASHLLNNGSITLGGALDGDSSITTIKSTRGKKQSRKLGTVRGKK